MAATTTRRPAAAQPDAQSGSSGHLRAAVATPRPAAALGIALAVVALYAAFASGSIGVTEESRLQVVVATLAFTTLAGLLYGRGLRADVPAAAKWGVALLVGFAAWAALSIVWSVAPDDSWQVANRSLAFALLVALGITLGSSLPRAAERAAVALLGVITLIALYALGGKLFPWVHVGGLIDLNHTDRFSRLRAPLDYWNALAMVCVLAVPIAMRVATQATYRTRTRTVGLLSLVLVLTTLALTYSRGGLIVAVAAIALVIAVGPARLPLAAALATGVIGMLPPTIVALSLSDLTTDGVPVGDRTGDGLILLGALVLGLVLAAVIGTLLVRVAARVRLGQKGVGRARRAVLVAAIGVVVVVLAGLALSDRGIGGTISHQADEFAKPKLDRQNDPARVLRTNSGNRWVWWTEAVSGFRDRPVVGYGAGSFATTHRAYRTNSLEVRQPHSVPLQFLSETGVIGALLALGGLAALGFAAARSTLARAEGTDRGFAVALLAGAFAWSLHLWVDWDWDIPGVTLPVLVVLGLLSARPMVAAAPVRPGIGGRAGILAVGAALAAVAVVLAALPSISAGLSSDALSRAASGTPSALRAGEEKAALAKRLDPLAVQPLFAQAAIAQRANQSAAAGALLVDAVNRQPDNPDAWTRLLRFQVLANDTVGALRSISSLFALDPVTAVRSGFYGQLAVYDPARSASATGTPLPEKLVAPKPAPPQKKTKKKKSTTAKPGPTQAPGATKQQTPAAPAPTPAPAPAPTPTPTPAPTPTPTPKKQAPAGDPFRLEG